MDKNRIIALIKESEGGDVDAVLANRPVQERLEMLKDIENFMQYIGYAGECRVMAELLIRGVNALVSRVDNGFDITATRGDEIYLIQVKTAFLDKENIFSFNIQNGNGGTEYAGKHPAVYVFVLVSGKGEAMNFLVLPKAELEKQKQAGNIWFVASTQRDKVKIYLRGGKAFLGKVDNDVSQFLDNWSPFTGEERDEGVKGEEGVA